VIFLKFEDEYNDKHNDNYLKHDEEYDENYAEYEDTTKYGEFVSSYFAWISLDITKKLKNQCKSQVKN
jgi:hypothetical protein